MNVLKNRSVPPARWFATGVRLLCAGVLLSAPLGAEESSLIENSPFLPPNFGKPDQPPPKKQAPNQGPLSREIEFRSVISINRQWLFSLYNTTEKKSIWVSLNDPAGAYKVTQYEADDQRIELVYNGQREWMDLKEPSGLAGSGDTPRPGTARRSNDRPSIRNASTLNRPRLNRRSVPRRRVVVPKQSETEPPNRE